MESVGTWKAAVEAGAKALTASEAQRVWARLEVVARGGGRAAGDLAATAALADADGRLPLHHAALRLGNPVPAQVVARCLEAHPDAALVQAGRRRRTPLHEACATAPADAAVVALLAGAAPGACVLQDASGATPLHLALRGADAPAALAVLAPRGSARAARAADKAGSLPLHLAVAAETPDPRVVKALLEAFEGAKKHRDKKGRVPRDRLDAGRHYDVHCLLTPPANVLLAGGGRLAGSFAKIKLPFLLGVVLAYADTVSDAYVSYSLLTGGAPLWGALSLSFVCAHPVLIATNAARVGDRWRVWRALSFTELAYETYRSLREEETTTPYAEASMFELVLEGIPEQVLQLHIVLATLDAGDIPSGSLLASLGISFLCAGYTLATTARNSSDSAWGDVLKDWGARGTACATAFFAGDVTTRSVGFALFSVVMNRLFPAVVLTFILSAVPIGYFVFVVLLLRVHNLDGQLLKAFLNTVSDFPFRIGEHDDEHAATAAAEERRFSVQLFGVFFLCFAGMMAASLAVLYKRQEQSDMLILAIALFSVAFVSKVVGGTLVQSKMRAATADADASARV